MLACEYSTACSSRAIPPTEGSTQVNGDSESMPFRNTAFELEARVLQASVALSKVDEAAKQEELATWKAGDELGNVHRIEEEADL